MIPVLQLLEAPGRVPVQWGGTGPSLSPLVEGREDVEQLQLAPEVAFVERAAEDGFVNALQLGERELPWEQLEADRRVLQLVAQALDRIPQDGIVVERERRVALDRAPARRLGIGPGAQRAVAGDEGVIGDRHDPASRVTIGSLKV
jgi:hypothetical protein